MAINIDSILQEYNMPDLLDKVNYSYEGFINDKELFSFFDEIIKTNSKVLIHGDPDVDGAFSVKIIESMFDRLGYSNYEIYRYNSRSHTLTPDAITYMMSQGFPYVIILDSSSNSMNEIYRLCRFGIKVAIIDHHECNFEPGDYPDGCLIVNTTIDNHYRKEDYYLLSAGALCFCLASEYLKIHEIGYEDLSAYALVSLYSDCIDMTHQLNRSIYYLATSLPRSSLPRHITCLMTNKNIFCRRFIEYSYAPKINALFRAEEFNLVNAFLFDKLSYVECESILERIKNNHAEKRTMINMVTDGVRDCVEVLDNICLVDLSKGEAAVIPNKLYNYTGLIANELAQEFSKPCIVYCGTSHGIKASFRDLYNRNYLRVFQQFSPAKGHPSAFAIPMPPQQLCKFLYTVRNFVDKRFYLLGVTEPIMIEYEAGLPQISFINDIALLNEFTGNKLPVILLTKRNDMKCVTHRGYYNQRIYSYDWGPHLTLESTSYLVPGSQVKIKPIVSKKTKLLVYNRDANI